MVNEGVRAQTTLYVTGSAVPGGEVIPLEKWEDGTFKFHGPLVPGELYIINTSDVANMGHHNDGYTIRSIATENCISIFTALDTVSVLLDVLEETTICVSTIDA